MKTVYIWFQNILKLKVCLVFMDILILLGSFNLNLRSSIIMDLYSYCFCYILKKRDFRDIFLYAISIKTFKND